MSLLLGAAWILFVVSCLITMIPPSSKPFRSNPGTHLNIGDRDDKAI